MANPPRRFHTPSDTRLVTARITLDDIRDIATANAFDKGQRYWRQGNVIDVKVDDAEGAITSRVRGSERKPYSQVIEIGPTRDDWTEIDGHCSCPVGYNCKHVVAVLLKLVADKDTASPMANRVAPASPPEQPKPEPPTEQLSPQLAAWIDNLASLALRNSEDYPPGINQRLIYVLDIARSSAGIGRLTVKPMSVRLLKSGRFASQPTPFALSHGPQQNPAKFIRPSDTAILRDLAGMPHDYQNEAISLTGETGAKVLSLMLATGRARWQSIEGSPLTQGPERHGNICWRLADDGSYAPDIALSGATPETIDNGQPVLLAPPWYIDVPSGVAGPVETGQSPRMAAAILSAPPAPVSQIPLLRSMIGKRLPDLASIAPPEAAPLRKISESPVSGIRLTAGDLPTPRLTHGWRKPEWDVQQIPVIRPFFRYGDVEIPATDMRDRPTFSRNGEIVEVARNAQHEKRSMSHLGKLGLSELAFVRPFGLPPALRGDWVFAGEAAYAEWLDFLYRDVPMLEARGWSIQVADDFPIRLLRSDGQISASIEDRSGIDWFNLDLGIVVNGERVDLAEAIISALQHNVLTESAADDAVYVMLPDGRTLAVPAAQLAPIISTLRELLAAGGVSIDDGKLRFSPGDAASLSHLEQATAAAGTVWRGGERIREMGRLLRETDGIPQAKLPPTFVASLRPYQQRGVNWLQFLRTAGFGGILADDMGLGKTVQTLAHITVEKANGRLHRPALLVAPTSVITNWRREAERFAPDLKVLMLYGRDRHGLFDKIGVHDLVLTTYPLLMRDHENLQAISWSLLVLDEAQSIKNPDAATTRNINTLNADHRICLTGTPLENHLGELWSLFNFVSPGFLGDRRDFNQRWRKPIEKLGDTDRQRSLARRVRPFILRRTKAEVAVDLPPKTEIVETIEMNAAQRRIYDTVRLAMHNKVRKAIAARGFGRSRIVVLDALLKLRQICCDPRLLKLKSTGKTEQASSEKLDRLIEMVAQLIGEGRRILLFSQFTSMLALIEAELDKVRIPYVLLTGDTKDRETPVHAFQTGKVPLFLISLKAGGVGLNLTTADTVIHYDPWWNPAVEDQATDRAHRIGQDKPVFVYKLMTFGSVEERMEALKARKHSLAKGLFDPEAGPATLLTEADVEDLFGPL